MPRLQKVERAVQNGRRGEAMRTIPLSAPHVLGLDLGTSNLRLFAAHFDHAGAVHSGPDLISLPGSCKDGSVPMVLKLDAEGRLRTYGQTALREMIGDPNSTLVSEFKPCIGQAPEDLEAQGRPESEVYCNNPDCPHPGWAWPVGLVFCGYCGHSLKAPDGGSSWRPSFRYGQEEALGYAEKLLSDVARLLAQQLGGPISTAGGWMVEAGVPVHWQEQTRNRYLNTVRKAFSQARVELMYEPSGALRFYTLGERMNAQAGWTLVIDFGAGTTDLVLARVGWGQGGLRLDDVRSYGERYGGADFDLVLAHIAAEQTGVRLDTTLLADWRLCARDLKEAFSHQMHLDPNQEVRVSFPVPRTGGFFEYESVSLDRALFERVGADLVQRFHSLLERGLRHFNMGGSQIAQIVMTGGGAHWYFVRQAVQELFPNAHVLSGVEPEKAVSKGLALGPAALPHPPAGEVSQQNGTQRETRNGLGPESRQPVSPPPQQQPSGPPPVTTVGGRDLTPDVYADLEITAAEQSAGCTKHLEVDGQRIPVYVSPGTTSGSKILVRSVRPGNNGGRPGNLHVTVTVQGGNANASPPPAVRPTRGLDDIRVVRLTREQASAGKRLRIQTCNGDLPLRIPAGTRSGPIRIAGKGWPGKHGGPSGDLVLEIEVSR